MDTAGRDLDINYASDLHLIKSMYEDDSYWERIFDAKLDYLNFGINPHESKFVRREVANSWIISRTEGLAPDQEELGEYVSSEFFEEALQRNALMVEETRQRIQAIDSLNMENDYVFELMDANGLSLLQVGDLQLHQFVGDKYLVSEKNAGTNAHTLCMRHKKPFTVIGPEHYCFALHCLIACAAPVFDQMGTSIGALLLTQLVPNTFTSADKKVLVHAMSLISSLASTISSQLRAKEYRSALSRLEAEYSHASSEALIYESVSRDLIDAVLDGTLVMDSMLTIHHANPEAGHIFKTSPDELVGRHICDLLDLGTSREALEFFEKGQRREFKLGQSTYSLVPQTTFASKDESMRLGFILHIKEVRAASLGVRRAKSDGDVARTTFADILGRSPQIKRALGLASRFSLSDENTLIIGESGTGKELFAQAIHNAARPGGPFMSINCAAIPPRLIESELFGYEAGSFTGADKGGKPGKIELADGGTLFLDEIGDMPLELQATLLRVLENKRVMRIGGRSYKQVNFRLVSATNRNLPELTASGKFREDLLYRLSVLTVELPALRERDGDAVFFANYFLNECRVKTNNGAAKLSDEAARFVATYPWPGNVRQLKHAIYSAYYTCEDGVIALDDFPAYIVKGAPNEYTPPKTPSASPYESYSAFNEQPASPAEKAEAASAPDADPLPTLRLEELESLAIREALRRADGNIMAAANLLGISKATLYRKIKRAEPSQQEQS